MGYEELVKTRADVPVSDTQAYRQFGNSVVPHVVTAVGRQIVEVMQTRIDEKNNFTLLKKNGRPKRRTKSSV